ncbi:MAG: LPS export ABC transporter permease LptG [Nitrospinae bacterium]|nr:LPS export ABC transporter permease LptG [Nitrospinota bacterium]
MKTVDRYIITEFGRIFLLALVTLMAFYEMVVFLDMVGYFVKFHATSDMVFRYMLFRAPMAVFHVTPICVLLAALLTMGSMSRYSELVAMKACGMSMPRIAAPILAVCGLICLLSFLDSEYLFHISAKESNRIYYEEIKKQPRKGLFSNEMVWYKADDGSIWNIGHLDMGKRELRDLSIFSFDPTGSRVVLRATAREGKVTNGSWTLNGYSERRFLPGGGFEEKHWETYTSPANMITLGDLDKVQLDPEEMNLIQIREYIREIKSKGYDYTRHVVDMHAKVAFPLISIVMPLIAIPLGVRSSRAGGALVGIGVAVVTGALFWFSFSMAVAFGQAGRIPPELAAYGSHIVFAAAGFAMLLRSERG